LKSFAPDIVVGTGGYVSGPVVMAATKQRIPTAIHEQNAQMGMTTKHLANRVDVLLLGMSNDAASKAGIRSFLVGNPVRSEILSANSAAARERLGVPDGKALLLSFGGSLGSRRFNEIMADLIVLNNRQNAFRHIHAAGSFGIKWLPDLLHEKGVDIQQQEHLDLREYIHDMPDVMAAADLVICRAGAITLSELAVLGKPAILIPSPNVTNNHQHENAQVFNTANAAIVLEESQCSGEKLFTAVCELLKDRDRLTAMGDAAKAIAIPDSAQRIFDVLVQLVADKKSAAVMKP